MKNVAGSAAIIRSRWATLATRTADTPGLGTRGRFGATRSRQAQANPRARTRRPPSGSPPSIGAGPSHATARACVASPEGRAAYAMRADVEGTVSQAVQMSYRQWAQYGALQVDDAKRLKLLKNENRG